MTDWTRLRVVDLKDELKRRGLPYNGLKQELIARLNEADDEAGEAERESKDLSADDEQIATESTPEGPAEGEPEIAAAESPEDVIPSNEDDATIPAPVSEAENTRTREESQVEAMENGVADARSSSTVEAEPKPTDSTVADEPMQHVEEGGGDLKSTPAPDAPVATNSPAPETRESQKRKRRSVSPLPTEEEVARKRARPDDDTINGTAPRILRPEDQDRPEVETTSGEMQVDEQPKENHPVSDAHEAGDIRNSSPNEYEDNRQDLMEIEKNAVPSLHPPTSALYIKNFMRPLRPIDVQTHLVDLATPAGVPLDNGIIVNFFLDQIRTHAFVVFKSAAAASRVRAALHECVWPNESNRKPLWVDFVPPNQVQDWIDKEESGGRRSGARWEVVYEDGPNGEMEAHLESGAASVSRAGNRPPPGPLANPADAIPSAPRGHREAGGPPTGPRGPRAGPGSGPRPLSHAPGGDSQRTKTHPVIHYQPVSEDLARRRIEKMHSHYTSDHDRDVGREINRYSFENGDTFVDRGKEVFEGIRPPHRERAVERERRGFGGGGGGRRRRGGRNFRPRSDRYLPNEGSSRDNRRPRYNDGEDQGRGPSRNDDDRNSFRSRDNRDRRY